MIRYKDSGWSYDFEHSITMKQLVNETTYLTTKLRIYTVYILLYRDKIYLPFFTELEQFGSFSVYPTQLQLDETLIRNDSYQSEHTIMIGAD